jgi:predicted alpha-1,2-mannosidase
MKMKSIKKNGFVMRILSILLILMMISCKIQTKDCTQFVDPFIGTSAHGHTYPAACVPFGMVQVGPDTGTEGWDWCSGYHASDSSIMGFSHTHVSGTGCPAMGDILLMPMIGEPRFTPGSKLNPKEGYRSRFKSTSEIAKPGYYAVKLDDCDVYAEMTATPRVGFHRYTFPSSPKASIIIDLEHGIDNIVQKSSIKVVDNRTIVGSRNSKGFVKDEHIYFCARFSKPFEKTTSFTDGVIANEKSFSGKATKIVLHFKTFEKELILVKVGLSTVSEQGAANNIATELPGWDFDTTVNKTDKTWEKQISKVEIETDRPEQKKTFYTALYHCFLSPNLISDADGSFRGWDGKNHRDTSKMFYTNFSLWDTYRALHPLFVLLCPDKNVEFINSMLERYKEIGTLPMNEYGINETYCMIGNHAIPVIADAYLKGLKGFDAETAYKAVRAASTISHSKSDWETYNKYGYLPFDLVKEESVSRTLELSYDDYCVAQMAKALGKTDDYAYFSKRAHYYQNLFDPQTGLMRGKDSNGKWRVPFDKLRISHAGDAGGDYTEGNAWQYTWSVQQDVEGLIRLMGGKEVFANKLDSLFKLQSIIEGSGFTGDVSGLIGQYAQGNEPCHHVAYLFDFAGQSWKTQKMINAIKNTMYTNAKDGLCGNDDCGQMSAWYVFSSLGFYPVTPGSDSYMIGTPSFKRAKIHLQNGEVFTIKASAVSKNNFYVQQALLNGQNYSNSAIRYTDIQKGGTIEFIMGKSPQEKWGN